jgi:hypothetical protein
MATRKTRYDNQVAAESALKYGPQLNALAMLLTQAQQDRDQGLSVQRSTAQGLAEQARVAAPDVTKANSAYLSQLLQARQLVGQDAGALGAGADPFRAASARDMGNAVARAAETTRSAQSELTQRGLDARAGAIYGAKAVEGQYADERDKIRQQLQNVTGEQGTFSATRLAELLGDDRKQAHDTAQAKANRDVQTTNAANQNATTLAAAGVNPDGSIIPGGKADPKVKDKNKPKKWATPGQVGSFQDQVGSLQTWIKAHQGDYLKSAGGNAKKARAAMAQDLANGVPGTSMTDMDPNSKTYGQLLKDPGVPKAKSQLALSVALDLNFDQHVSHPNIVRLHKRRYKLKDLGFPIAVPSAAPPFVAAPAPDNADR